MASFLRPEYTQSEDFSYGAKIFIPQPGVASSLLDLNIPRDKWARRFWMSVAFDTGISDAYWEGSLEFYNNGVLACRFPFFSTAGVGTGTPNPAFGFYGNAQSGSIFNGMRLNFGSGGAEILGSFHASVAADKVKIAQTSIRTAGAGNCCAALAVSSSYQGLGGSSI